jgi:ribosomal protein S12 methylthiotransferase accessory factor
MPPGEVLHAENPDNGTPPVLDAVRQAMEIKVKFLDRLRLEARFDDFTIIADQPIRYKGDGSAPGPFDYFLASSALCAAYFVKLYCDARAIPTEHIRLAQNNIVDPENRYQQTIKIQVELPADISDKDREGILRSIDRCTVKKAIQTGPVFVVEAVDNLDADAQALLLPGLASGPGTCIAGKDLPLEQTIANLSGALAALGMKIEIASWRNIVPNVWSLNIRDAHSPMCFSNGKGSSKESALASALGEFIERINCNHFYNDQFWGDEFANAAFVHYPDERWFKPGRKDALPKGLLDAHCLQIYNADGELLGSHLYDTNSGNVERGICALPFVRQSDGAVVYFPTNLIDNLFLSNGMSAGNTLAEAQVQCLSEIFERAVKREILEGEIALPDVPPSVLAKFPGVVEGIQALEAQGFPVLVKDASLGGRFPVMCVTLMNPRTGGVFASFGAHPRFDVALERSLTELLQGRSFEGLNDLPAPTFESAAVTEPNNFVEHFIDSSGLVSWRFFSAKADHPFVEWDFSNQGKHSNSEEAASAVRLCSTAMGKEVYLRGVRPARRHGVPHSGAGVLGGLSGRRPDLGQHQQGAGLPRRHPQSAPLGRCRAGSAARTPGRQRARRLHRHHHPDRHRVRREHGLGTVDDSGTEAADQSRACHAVRRRAGAGPEPTCNTTRTPSSARLFYQAVQVVLEVQMDDELGTGRLRGQLPPPVWRCAHGCRDRLSRRPRAILRPDADQPAVRRSGPPPAPARQLPETAHGASECHCRMSPSIAAD